MHAGQGRVRFNECLAHAGLHVGVPNIDVDLFHRDQVADQLSINRRHDFISAGEADAARPGPGQPGGGVRFPFGGHAVTEFGRGLARDEGRAHVNCFKLANV